MKQSLFCCGFAIERQRGYGGVDVQFAFGGSGEALAKSFAPPDGAPATPESVREHVVQWLRDLEAQRRIGACVDECAEQLVVERDVDDPCRLNIMLPAQTFTQLIGAPVDKAFDARLRADFEHASATCLEPGCWCKGRDDHALDAAPYMRARADARAGDVVDVDVDFREPVAGESRSPRSMVVCLRGGPAHIPGRNGSCLLCGEQLTAAHVWPGFDACGLCAACWAAGQRHPGRVLGPLQCSECDAHRAEIAAQGGTGFAVFLWIIGLGAAVYVLWLLAWAAEGVGF